MWVIGAENDGTGTWYEEDTLYVFTIQVPDNRLLTSMKLQENQGNRYVTVGSPRIQVIPAEFIGKQIIFTRSKPQIDSEVGQRAHVPDFRLAYFEEGLRTAGYGQIRRVLKPSTDVDIQMISQSAYPVFPTDTVETVSSAIEEKADTAATVRSDETVTVDSAASSEIESKNSAVEKPVISQAESPTAEPVQETTSTDSAALIPQKNMKPAVVKEEMQHVSKQPSQPKQQNRPPVNSGKQPQTKRQPSPKAPSKAPWGTIFNQGILNGLALEMSVASPYWVSENLNTWYSSIDWRFSFTMPFYYRAGSVMVGASFEWSSYDFENTFPEGGRFQGQAKLAYVSTYWRGLILELGGGKFSDTTGFIGGISGKILEGEHLYLGGGMRGVIIQEIQSIGQGHWADGRLTLGYKF
ncbi:MAG: hypothetical protein K9N34_01995 [Candidatus Marinimicrobia bacterium]|nr:hypothetical protein [Candidatus Neomarinimicrobiota bacterium]